MFLVEHPMVIVMFLARKELAELPTKSFWNKRGLYAKYSNG